MQALAGRLLLLVLLALDWAAAPTLVAPALQSLARPWANTENVCPSGAYREAMRRECAPEPQVGTFGCMPREGTRPTGKLCPASRTSAAVHGTNMVYVFMTLRR